MDPILRQMNPVHNLKSYLFNIHYNINLHLRGCIKKFPDLVDNEINNNNNNNNNDKHWLRRNTKGYGVKTHLTGSQNSDTTAPSDIALYYLQFSLQAASPETFGYTLVHLRLSTCLFPLGF
jgi:hypothetical protein